ncbi:hypothetical protein Tco_1171863 [Tanacetum coccineum]
MRCLVFGTEEDIIEWIQPVPPKRIAKSITNKLIVAATTHFIWQEQNNRLFKKKNRTVEKVHDVIISMVRLKLLTFRFNNTNQVMKMLELWKMPKDIVLYGSNGGSHL